MIDFFKRDLFNNSHYIYLFILKTYVIFDFKFDNFDILIEINQKTVKSFYSLSYSNELKTI